MKNRPVSGCLKVVLALLTVSALFPSGAAAQSEAKPAAQPEAKPAAQPEAKPVPQPGAKSKAKTGGMKEAKPGTIERGRYLVVTGGCNDCHTPWKMGPKGPAPDMTKMLSGHPAELIMPAPPKLEGPWGWAGAATMTAFSGPWGISYAANLTPDDSTGTGQWTFDQFNSAMKTGTHIDGKRPILPPMPWPNVAHMTDDDLKAIFAYLKSIPPIKNAVPLAVVVMPPAAPPAKSGKK